MFWHSSQSFLFVFFFQTSCTHETCDYLLAHRKKNPQQKSFETLLASLPKCLKTSSLLE